MSTGVDETALDETAAPAAELTPAVRQALEAILFLADAPVPVDVLVRALEVDEAGVREALADLDDELTTRPRGFVLRNVAGGWRLSSHPDAAAYVEQWVLDGRAGRLTPAALETLAVIAYKQPISRSEVGEVRGVSADGAVRSLVQRGFVHEVGRSEAPGQPVLFGTTALLLEQLGLASIEDLPPLTEYLTESAPDEPAGPDLRTARSRIASGEDLAQTGSPRWDPTSRAAALVAAVQDLRAGADDVGDGDERDADDHAGEDGHASALARLDAAAARHRDAAATDDHTAGSLADELTSLVQGLARDDTRPDGTPADLVDPALEERLASLRARRSERDVMTVLTTDLDEAADAAMSQVDAALAAVERDARVAAGEEPDDAEPGAVESTAVEHSAQDETDPTDG